MSDNGCPIDKNDYLAFDALTLKDHIKNMLSDSSVFTDQNYEGSNISTLTDIVAYTFNVLMFYLNRTSSEGMFSDAQLYENMNRIVKMLDYKPIGNQSSTLSFQASATSDIGTVGVYTIPRYSFFQLEGVPYSFNEDIFFSKTVTGLEALTEISNEKLLYQGKFEEYPTYTANGDENEVVFLAPGSSIKIDHFNVYVYVKPLATGIWEEWKQSPSLYMENAGTRKYEIRLNENKSYELKFGNNINGKKLEEGDLVAIYYLRSNGSEGEVGAGVLNGKLLTKYETTRYNAILNDIITDEYNSDFDFGGLSFNNDSVSTFSSTEETVDEIRANAPNTFRSQYRLVTEADYTSFIKTNFANIVHDVKVANNWKYMSEHFKYYYDLGLTNPNEQSRLLYNQVLFADSCNFNNVYLVAVPKITSNKPHDISFLSAAQKELMLSTMNSQKTLTTELVILDPVHIAVNLAIPSTGAVPSVDDVDNTELAVIKTPSSRRDSESIKNEINNIFLDYFSRSNTSLGQTINVKELTTSILAVNGVKTFYVRRIDDPTVRVEGLSLLIWNHVYPNDINVTGGDVALSYFKIPYLYDKANFINKLKVESESRIYEGLEY